MITKIDINNFGLFSGYKWSQNIGNDLVNNFKKLNIIYGRNYSGKTTLSRIIKCVADGNLHEKYTDGEFIITNADDTISSNTSLVSPYNIRVYNTDFVRENLKFLYNEDEDIESFALVGADNNRLQPRIDEITQILGSVDSGVGTLFDEDKDTKALDIAKNGLKIKKDALSKKLTDKDNSHTKLRFSEIATFLNDIDYKAKKKEIEDMEVKISDDARSLKTLSDNNIALDLEKKEKEHAKKDEGTAAIKVNELLSSFFGHDGLMLDPETIHEDGTPKTKFIVKRGGAKAHNLSEGECSLIAFCYFIAKMADELKGADSDKLLIYIDDPISSLDNNHIFFMFSLIESVICKEKKYGQLFISTHNLDFLKYSKRLTTPATDSTDYFSIIREEKPGNGCRSVLKKMPTHLKENITEYNFLFSEIYKIAKPIGGNRSQCIENTYSLFYNLANNMRRFLECYLAYRLPNNEEPLSNLGLLFENHIPPLINRLINEGSHLTWGDKGTIAVDVPEAENVAKLILKAIKERDIEHFNALCDSTGSDKSIVL